MPVTLEITLHCRLPPSARRALEGAVKAAVKKMRGATGVINVSVVGNTRMRRLNREYRGKDRPTDVLSFPRGKPNFGEIGDILIAWPVIRAQAKRHGVTELDELRRMAVHGVLHLFGYDHEKSEKDEKIMFALQEKILKGLRG